MVVFPGTWSDRDCGWVIDQVLGAELRYLWHKDRDLQGCDCVILPGGFSHGDYLRTGAIARFSPVMESVAEFAERGGLVWGICNGFQIACEAGLLPGALLRNASLRFVCEPVRLRVENASTMFTAQYQPGQVLTVPIAHGEGRYTADEATLDRLEGNGQVLFRYVNAAGVPDEASNPNGSMRNIAGIVSERGNVLGMMPHPERAAELEIGSADGLFLFRSLLDSGVKVLTA